MINQKYVSNASAVLRLIPSEEIEIVINRGQKFSYEMWWWGDRSILWTQFAERPPPGEKPMSKTDAQLALSQVSGIPQRTLRYYHDHAAFFSFDIRLEYEPLPFSHFVVAKRFGNNWEKILNKSLDYLEQYHKLPSAEYLEWIFSRNAQPILEIDSQLSETATTTENTIEDIPTPEDELPDTPPTASTPVARDWILKMDQALGSLHQSIEPLPVSEKSKDRIRGALNDLHDAFDSALREISHTLKP